MNLHSLSYSNLFPSKNEAAFNHSVIKHNAFSDKGLQGGKNIFNVTPELTEKILLNNTWNIIYAKQKSNFNLIINSKYKFRFTKNNFCSADNGENTLTGQWVTGYDMNTLKLNIALRIPLELVTICKTWNVVETNEKYVRLITPAESSYTLEWLTLEKP